MFQIHSQDLATLSAKDYYSVNLLKKVDFNERNCSMRVYRVPNGLQRNLFANFVPKKRQ